jgi:hypothetical protein
MTKLINYKKIRQIKGMKKGYIKKYLIEYIVSEKLIFGLICASLHCFCDSDKNGLFLRTYGLIIIDAIASILYMVAYLKQFETDSINNYKKNKKEKYVSKPPLLDTKLGKDNTIIGYKILIWIIVALLYSLKVFINHGTYMTMKSGVDFTMFYFSLMYFDVFWKGGLKNFFYNLNSLKEMTNNESFVRKNVLYLLIFLVALYQIWSLKSEVLFCLSFLES